MKTIQERNFHLLMAGLFVTTLLVDPAMRSILESWRPPEIGFLTIIVGLVWIGRYTAWRSDVGEQQARKLRERLSAVERRAEEQHAQIEQILRSRKPRNGSI